MPEDELLMPKGKSSINPSTCALPIVFRGCVKVTQPLWHLIPKGEIFLDSITFAQSQDLQCLQLSLFGHGQAGRSWGQGFHEEIRFHGGLSKACFRKLSKIAGFFFLSLFDGQTVTNSKTLTRRSFETYPNGLGDRFASIFSVFSASKT